MCKRRGANVENVENVKKMCKYQNSNLKNENINNE